MDFVRPIEAIVPGAQGAVLAVLAETTAELNLRTVSQLAGVSPAQASRVLPKLVELGVVERREVPPSSLFRFVPDHVAGPPLLELARSADTVFDEIGRRAGALPRPPASVIVFGSFTRRLAGNPVEVLEVSLDEAASKLAGRSQVWGDIRRGGRVVHGLTIDHLVAIPSG